MEEQQEIKRHLEKLLECGAISPVLHASAYSQVLFLTKPDTKEKRLVLDYRALNECVSHLNRPLPNISHMIEQTGALKPKKFAKFDTTKDNWQLGQRCGKPLPSLPGWESLYGIESLFIQLKHIHRTIIGTSRRILYMHIKSLLNSIYLCYFDRFGISNSSLNNPLFSIYLIYLNLLIIDSMNK